LLDRLEAIYKILKKTRNGHMVTAVTVTVQRLRLTGERVKEKRERMPV
jgi:predicted ABC-type sugar transport system permease subunit